MLFHSPGDLPDPGIKSASPASLAWADGFFATEPPGKPFLAKRNTNWQSSINIYTLPCVKQIVGSCCVTQGAQLSAWGREWEGGSRRGATC